MRHALLAFALCACFHAQAQELDIVAPPAWEGGWKMVDDKKGPDWRLSVFLPAKAEQGSLARMVSIASTWGPKQGGSAHLMKQWTEHLQKTCPELSTLSTPVMSANDFQVAYARFYCPKRSDTGEGSVDYVKTIASSGGAYLVAVAQRTPPYATPKPGHMVYAAQADADAMIQWLKTTGDYLQNNVRACGAKTPLIAVCSS